MTDEEKNRPHPKEERANFVNQANFVHQASIVHVNDYNIN